MGKIHDRFIAKQMKMMDTQDRFHSKGKFKGHYDGYCNRSACLSPDNVHFYNIGSYAFYCEKCAHLLNDSNHRFKDINNGAPYVTYKTAEEADTLYVMPQRIIPELTKRM